VYANPREPPGGEGGVWGDAPRFGRWLCRAANASEYGDFETGLAVSAYQVHAYTLHGARVATVEVRARDGQKARDKARTQLCRQGRQPNRLTLVPVQVINA